jgi:hypothetical protein
MVAKSCSGKQVRVLVGHYPVMKSDEERAIATEIIGHGPAQGMMFYLPGDLKHPCNSSAMIQRHPDIHQ